LGRAATRPVPLEEKKERNKTHVANVKDSLFHNTDHRLGKKKKGDKNKTVNIT
jgi:hypothetical protein